MTEHIDISPELDNLREHIIKEIHEVRDDLRIELRSVSDRMTSGLVGVNMRLDTINGRVSKHDVDIAILKHDNEREEKTDTENRIENKFKLVLKDYASPISVVGMVLYLYGKSHAWW